MFFIYFADGLSLQANENTNCLFFCFQERAQIRLSQIQSSSSRSSPQTTEVSVAMLTPPKTDEKTRFVEYTG